MTKKIRIMTARYKNICLPVSEAKKVRGFFSNLDYLDSNLHNHTASGEEIYRYPLVQYKVLKKNPVIVAAEDGIKSIHAHLMNETEIKIGDRVYTDVSLDIHLAELPVGDSRAVRQYVFLTPWLALNQGNYEKYQKMDEEGRKSLLEHILIGNILSLCKGFDVTIENTLQAEMELRSIPVLYKEKRMEGFTGKFRINCCIPDMCGIGKGTARGFGTVKLIKDKDAEG